MNRMKTIYITLFALVISAAAALAAGTLPWAAGKGNAQVQNLKAVAPAAGKSRCDTSATATKGVYKNYSVAAYLGIEATVTDAAGAAVPVIWKEDGKEVWVGPTYSVVNNQNGGSTLTTLRYDNISSTAKKYKSCVRRQ